MDVRAPACLRIYIMPAHASEKRSEEKRREEKRRDETRNQNLLASWKLSGGCRGCSVGRLSGNVPCRVWKLVSGKCLSGALESCRVSG